MPSMYLLKVIKGDRRFTSAIALGNTGVAHGGRGLEIDKTIRFFAFAGKNKLDPLHIYIPFDGAKVASRFAILSKAIMARIERALHEVIFLMGSGEVVS